VTLKIYQWDKKQQMAAGRWHNKKKVWKNIFAEVGHPRTKHLCVQRFCFVYINFHSFMMSFQESLILNAIIYRCCLI